jgi:hypothetical protein
MTNNRILNVAATTISVVAGGWLLLSLNPHPPEIDRRPHEAAGAVLATEAMKLMEPGARLVVIARDPQPFLVPGSAAQLDGFLAALNEAGQSVASFQWIKLDPLRPAAVPPGDFFELLRQSKESDVIVSFMGPPMLTPQQLAKLGSKRPHVLAICPSTVTAQADLRRLFERKLLAVAIIGRHKTAEPDSVRHERNAFSRMFSLITSDNARELPEMTSLRR